MGDCDVDRAVARNWVNAPEGRETSDTTITSTSRVLTARARQR
jgi:hypothetical protein